MKTRFVHKFSLLVLLRQKFSRFVLLRLMEVECVCGIGYSSVVNLPFEATVLAIVLSLITPIKQELNGYYFPVNGYLMYQRSNISHSGPVTFQVSMETD